MSLLQATVGYKLHMAEVADFRVQMDTLQFTAVAVARLGLALFHKQPHPDFGLAAHAGFMCCLLEWPFSRNIQAFSGPKPLRDSAKIRPRFRRRFRAPVSMALASNRASE